ncbi:hypothetical protein AVEN_98151-1 [Araneus ventricosus]|uniref:Uncharacterized protein n=1 Tax=Araneus ventricosus TaxID=182803 RepID=A0A4Y2MQG9_ARAVE|nr:hypothetical protein AVEN_98151-1 [Araneus ventricosus]
MREGAPPRFHHEVLQYLNDTIPTPNIYLWGVGVELVLKFGVLNNTIMVKTLKGIFKTQSLSNDTKDSTTDIDSSSDTKDSSTDIYPSSDTKDSSTDRDSSSDTMNTSDII